MPKASRLSYLGVYRRDNKNKLYFIQQTTVVFMPISIGQPYHELDDLREILDLLTKNFTNKPLFKVMIADTVQKYSLGIKNKKNPEAMCDQARKEGDIWEEKNKSFIENKLHKNNVIFHRWEEWTSHELFKEARKEIENLYIEKNSEFYNAIEKDIINFEKRHFNREKTLFSKEEKEYCRECLKEECAVLIVWGKILVHPGYSCLFYPKPMTNSILFVNEKYTCFMSMSSELKSKSNRNGFYSNSSEISINNSANELTHSFSKIKLFKV